MAATVEYRCFVGGLAWATDERGLADAFSSFGEVVESKIINDRETGRSRGFGFVTFANEQSMLDAIESMNGKELDGRNITVNQAQSRSGGGGGGGGGYRGGYGGGRHEDRGGYGNRSSGGNYGGRERSERSYGGGRGGGHGGYGGRGGGYGGNNRYGGGGGGGVSAGVESETWRK